MRTQGRATRVGHECYLQAGLARPLIQEPNILENKAGKMLKGVQNSLNFQLHRGSGFRGFSLVFDSQTKRSRRDQRCLFPFSITPPRRFELKRATGRAVEPLARARLRSNNSTPSSNTSPAPYAFYPRIALQTPNTVPLFNANAEKLAGLANAQAAVAIERWRLAHPGQLPDTLAALVPTYLTAVPLDPYDGQPVRYKKLPVGYVVNSVGLGWTDKGERSGSAITLTVER